MHYGSTGYNLKLISKRQIDSVDRFLTLLSSVFVQASGITLKRWYGTTMLKRRRGAPDTNFNISSREHKQEQRLIYVYVQCFLSIKRSQRHTTVPNHRWEYITSAHRLVFFVVLPMLFSFPKEAYNSLFIWYVSFIIQKKNMIPASPPEKKAECLKIILFFVLLLLL